MVGARSRRRTFGLDRVRLRVRWLQTAHYILNANFRELKAVPDLLATDRTLLDVANAAAQVGLLFEFSRRLHNYLASVKTLVDHTRTFRSRHVSDPIFDTECDKQLQQLLNDPVIKFLQEFRNPVQHSQLPRVALTTTDTGPDGALRTQLTLSVTEILEMHEWSPLASQYIQEAQEGYYADKKYIDLVEAAQKYQRAITAFYEWFYRSIAIVKGSLLAEFVARRSELARIQIAKQAESAARSADP